MATENSGKYYFKGNFWAGGVIVDEYSVLQDENGDWWKYTGYRRTKPFNVMAGERPDGSSWVNVGTLTASGVTDTDVTFSKGGTIENRNQFVIDEMSGMWYYWNGPLPKKIPANSSVDDTGGANSQAWMPIEGLISQNLSTIKNLQQLVSGQADTIVLLTEMQTQQSGMITGIMDDQSTQNDNVGNQIKALSDIGQRVRGLEDTTKGGLEEMYGIRDNVTGVSEKAETIGQALDHLKTDVSLLSGSIEDHNSILSTQSEVLTSHQQSIDQVKKDGHQQTETLSGQQQAITSLQQNQTSLSDRVGNSEAAVKAQSDKTEILDGSLQAVQGRVNDVEKVSKTQQDTITDLSRRMTSEESSTADLTVTIKGQTERLVGFRKDLDNQGSSIKSNQDSLSAQGESIASVKKNVDTWQVQLDQVSQALNNKMPKPLGTAGQYIKGDGTIGEFPTQNPGTVTKIEAGAGLEGGAITSSGTISLPDVGTASNNLVSVNTDSKGRVTGGKNRSFSYPTRPLNTAFKVSPTRDASVSYSVDISVAALLLTGTSGRVILEYADDSAMSVNVVVVNEAINSVGGVLNVNSAGPGNVRGWIPANKFARIRTLNVIGTPTFSFVRSEEVLY